jgi:hypothetical protein
MSGCRERAVVLLPAILAIPGGASADDSRWSDRFGIDVLETANGQPGGTAYAVALDSAYVRFGGSFAKVSGLRVNNIVRIHRKTGRIERLGTADSCGVNGQVRALRSVPGRGLFVGGSFTHAGVDSAGQGGFAKAGDVDATNIPALKDAITREPLWDEGEIANGVSGIMGSGGLGINDFAEFEGRAEARFRTPQGA